MAQLPEEAQGAVIGVLIYTVFCLLCNILMLWLLWATKQTFSHIGLICLSTLVCVCANIAQQIYDNLFWVDVMTARFNEIQARQGNPILVVGGGVTGVDLALGSLRYCSETIAAGLACFWALSLTRAVYGWAGSANWDLVNRCGKVVSIVLPVVFISLCHLESVQSSPPTFFFLFDALYFGFVAGGAVFLLMILIKYIQTRMELKAWEVATYIDGRTTWRSFHLDDDASVTEMPTSHSTGIYDNWLLTRFSVAFIFMVIFLGDIVVIQLTGHSSIKADAAASGPDLSVSRAQKNFELLIPSAFPSALALFTFGTTKHFRDLMYRTFVPKAWQRRNPEQQQADHDGRERPPAPRNSSAEGAQPGLGERFADRGSWMTGVRTSGSVALEDMGVPRQSEGSRRTSRTRSIAD